MISVVTCTHNTPPDVLARTWASLKNQTHNNWEWVIIDDSPGWGTHRQLYGYCADERHTIRIYRPHTPSNGNIGATKHDAFMLARGELLVELDHDDELTPDALTTIQQYADKVPYSGFFYSDWCEILPDGQSGRYPEGWAFGYGDHYWDEQHQVWAMKAPEINRTTLSHIVSAPNHVRVWRSDLYHRLGGHNPDLPIADDYELCVRTALATRMTHIPKMLYKQHIGNHTAQRQRNGLIQELVARISSTYSDDLDQIYRGLETPAPTKE